MKKFAIGLLFLLGSTQSFCESDITGQEFGQEQKRIAHVKDNIFDYLSFDGQSRLATIARCIGVGGKCFNLNLSGGIASGGGAGLEVCENGQPTGFAKVSDDRTCWIIKAPATAGVVCIKPGATGFVIDGSSSGGDVNTNNITISQNLFLQSIQFYQSSGLIDSDTVDPTTTAYIATTTSLLTALTVNLPAAADLSDGQVLMLSMNGTALTVTLNAGAGTSVSGLLTGVLSNIGAILIYREADTTWYKVA